MRKVRTSTIGLNSAKEVRSMAKSDAPSAINLNTATRSSIIAEIRATMLESGRFSIWQTVLWRSRTGDMNRAVLLAAAAALGIGQ